MNKKHILILSVTAITITGIFWFLAGASERNQSPQPLFVRSAVVTKPNAPAPVTPAMAVPATVVQPAALDTPLAIEKFRAWTTAYLRAEAQNRAALEAEGQALAVSHAREIGRLIPKDPQLAIAMAVPMVIRQKLPKVIVALLEERPRLRADFEVYGNVPLPGQEATIEPYTRTVTAKDGKRWNAHVFGKRQWQRTTTNISINGVAVGREMAINDSSVRVLEVGELPVEDGREILDVCPISKIETKVELTDAGALPAVTEETPAFETPERVIYVCSGGHISQLAEQYMSDEEKAYLASLGTDLNSGAGSGPAHAPVGTVPGGWTLGNRSFLYIRACFPDNPVDPQSEQECYDVLKGMNDYIVQSSYGRCYFTYAVPPLVVLPYPLAWYSKYDTEFTGGDYLIQNHAMQIAKSMGYNTSNFNLYCVRWNGGPGAYGGSASVNGSGMRLKGNGLSTFLHELGHNLGVWHANRWETSPPSFIGPGSNHEYGNKFDIMGVGAGTTGHYTASFKNTLSWMPQEQFWNVTSSGLYRIHQFESGTADPSLRYALRIKKDAEKDYWAEFRQLLSNTAFNNGLMMTWDMWGIGNIGGSGGSPYNGSNKGAHLLDMTPGSFGNGVTDTRDDSGLYIGRTYTDPESNIHLTPVMKNTVTTPPSIDVRVQIGDTPGNNAPTLAIGFTNAAPATATNITLTAIANDVDGDTLAYAWVFDDGTYSTNNSAVQTKSWATAGYYRVLCTVSDMKGKRTTKGVLITVGTPTNFTVSGNITGPDALPIEGAYVANYAMSIGTSHGNSTTFKGTWTDSDGNYTLTGLAAGSFSITPNLYPLNFTASGFTNPVAVGPNATAKDFTSVSLPALTITYPDSVAAEGAVANPATIRLNREGSTAAALTVQIYNVNTGSATRNTDYTLSPAPTASTNDTGSGTSEYVIPIGASFLDITLTPVQDSTAEGVEYAVLDFANTASGFIFAGSAKATVAITDDDSTLSVVKITSVDDSGHEIGPDALTLKLERNGNTAAALNVNLTYTGTATNVSDYAAPATVSIPAGSASTTFVITPVNDAAIESTETIICTIATNAAYLRDGTALAVTSILNDDDMPTVTLTATDAAASETSSDKGLFTITRTGSTAAALTVDYAVNGRAVMGTDYRRLEGRAIIPVGSATTTVEIVPLDDTNDEGTQDVILQLRTTLNYVIGTANSGTVTIADNDASQIYVELNTGNGVEPVSGSANGPVFQITRPASGTAITVNYQISGTATSGVDFTALSGSIAFATGDGNKTITVSMLADTDFEDAETITLTLLPGTGYTLMPTQLSSMTAWIFDVDQEVVDVNVADSTSGLTAPFNETTTTGEDFFISRRVSTASDLVVNYTMTGTATEGSDYTVMSGTATILANTTSVYVNVAPINDTIPEGVETIVMNISPVSGSYGVRAGSATMLLGDNDSYSGISVGFAGASATTTESVGTYNVPVNITGTPAGDVTVQYRVNGGTAAGNGIDFALAEGSLTFPNGTTSLSIPIAITGDILPEPAETVVLQLLNVVGANLGTSAHTVTITNLSMPEAFTDPATAILSNGATLNGRVFPGGLATTVWFEYGATTAYGNTTAVQNISAGSSSVNVTQALIAVGLPTCQFRLVAQNSAGSTYGINQSYVVSNIPSVTSLASTAMTPTGATLNGIANTNGVDGSVWFEYGLDTNYGSTTTPVALLASTSNVAVVRAITGLPNATQYHYRCVLQTSVATVYGDNFTFTTTTPLLVRTGSFTGAGQTGVSLDGLINPGGASADYYFEYGTDTSYGSQTPTQNAGSGSASMTVRAAIQNLDPDTTYHMRLVGVNTGGATYGDDQIITTLPLRPSSIVESAFAYIGTGTAPQAPLHLAADGTMWGTTSTGGTYNRGTAFKLSENGTLATLASFYGNTNNADSGNTPQGNLVRAGDGNFYGTTNTGGTANNGSIFRLTPDGEVTTLVNFTGTAGAYLGSNPINGLTLGSDGALYGVAQNSNNGYIFKVTTSGVFTTLVAFTGTTGANLGSAPRGNLVLGSDGNFYGTTASGGSGGGFGTVFKMTPAGVLTTLVNFTGTTGVALGATPTSGLVQHSDGNFYGMTSLGGAGNIGTLFQMTPAGLLTTLVQFTGTTGVALGSTPKGTLTLGSDGALYGSTTLGGNVSTGLGTVFKCTTAGVFTTLVNFSGTSGAALGQSPNGGLVLHPNGGLYGTTSAGGLYASGSVFEVGTDGSGFTSLVSCTPLPGLGKLVQASDGKLYGTTLNGGGSTNVGMAIALPIGGAAQVLNVLTPVSGTTAWDARSGFMQASDGALYATAATGAGSSTNGGVFKMTTNGTLTTLFSFSGTTGSNLGASPRGVLITGHDGQLWGITNAGGTNGTGAIFKTTLGGVQTTLVNLTVNSGANPGSSSTAALLLANDGNYYGTTNIGGTGLGTGTQFRLTPAGVHSVIFNHNASAPGSNPTGYAAQGADGHLYGATVNGGIYTIGVLYRCTTGGIYTRLANFSGTSGDLPGNTPSGGVFAGPDGHFYGVTTSGGIYNSGTLFRLNRDGTAQSLHAFSGRDEGTAPGYGLAVASDGSLYGVSNTSIFRVNLPAVPLALSATSITAVSASLNGSVDSNGESGSFWFEVNGVATAVQSFTASSSTQNRTAALTNLLPLQTYRYRAVAVTSSGTYTSVEKTFTTASTITFANANTVPITSNEYTASGTPAIALDFVPNSGDVLKLVNNTGFLPISGTFNNLPEGSAITAMYNGTPFLFEITYGGGDGNDITLTAVSEVITFPAVGVKYIGDAAFSLAATSSGTSAVAYQIVAGGASAAVSGSMVTLTVSPGTVTIKATAGTALPKYQTFVLAPAGTGFVQISASKAAEFTLAIRANGTLWAWGVNGSSQLGDATTTTRRSPVQVGSATNWRQVSAGTSHAVATRADGTLWAWGLNTNGQLGDATTTTRTSPTQIGAATDWAWVVAGANHSIAVKTTGTLWAWGLNSSGQCGQGNTTTTSYTAPTQIGTVTNWGQTGAQLHAGGDFTLAIQNGTLWSWGFNGSSQLGDGSTTNRASPLQVGTATNWSRVAACTSTAAGLRTDGTAWAWGSNSGGQIGDGSLSTRSLTFQFSTATNWQNIVGGGSHFIATRSDGTLWSWGSNATGQLGQGYADIVSRGNTPMPIGVGTTWQEIAAGTNHSFAVTDGALHGWGSNNSGQLAFTPRTARPLTQKFGPVLSANGGGNGSLIQRADGGLWTIGSNSIGQLGIGSADSSPHPFPSQISSGAVWKQFSRGNSHALGVRTNGSLWGFGFNTSSQLGNDSAVNSTSLVQIGVANDWASVSAGDTHSLALKLEGSLWAWGLNSSGQLGDGTFINRATPVQIGTMTDWESVYTGTSGFSVARKRNGTLWAWGLNSSSQLGDGTTTLRNTPTQIGIISDWVRVAVGANFVLGIRSGGTLWAWGINSNNQLGDGTTITRNVPTQIGTAANWKSVAAHNVHCAATRSDGTLWTWGANAIGYLGNGSFVTRSSPTQLGIATCWNEAMAASASVHTLVTTTDGNLWAFGWNNLGQIGLAERTQLEPSVIVPALTTTPQTLTFAVASAATIGSTLILNATASSGLPARYIVSGAASLNGDKLTITGPGFVSVIAYQLGDSYWQSSDIRHAYINLSAPTASTVAVSNVTATSATLNATVNPNGAPTTVQFQSGTSVSYGTNTAVTLSAPSGIAAESVSLPLTGLIPGTTYHYRISTSNLGGTVNGSNVTFTTPNNNADLSNLTISIGTMIPSFASTTLNYAASVPVTTTSLNVNAFRANANATLRLRNNGAAFSTITSGTASAVALQTGLNNVQIEVAAQDGITQRLYSLQITRSASFTQWSTTVGITGSGSETQPLGDYDGDGVANVIEYAFGMSGSSPTGLGGLVVNGGVLSATGQPISLSLSPLGSGPPEWCAIFIRRKDHVQAGLTYTPNFSTTLESWEPSLETPTVLADDGIYQALCLPYPTIGGQPAKFFSVGITITP